MNVISLINMKGGVGKTTLSVNLCDCLARRHSHRVLLIDIDPQFNATQCLMNPEEYIEHRKNDIDTITNIFDRSSRQVVNTVNGIEEKQAKKLEEIMPTQIHENFDLLPGSLELYRIEMSSGEGREHRLNRYLEILKESDQYDTIIIDTPPTPSIWMTSALLASDYYLIPVKPDPISFTGIDLLQSIIDDKKENYALKIQCAGVVLTMVEDTTLVYRQAVETLSNSKWAKYKFEKELPKRTAIARTQMSKNFILDLDDSTAKTSIAGIVDELIRRIN
ncbi:ParA family protein [Pontibacter chitinilyticus]|uniref:ParA family protein n=1 Tax=Pontibacter chitinilyticus TaxID=2674989 RepID=UPI003219FC69